MRKRSLVLLLLPIILIIWTIGWAFFWTGNQRAGEKSQPRQEREDGLEITVHLPQQEQDIVQ